MVDVNLPAFNGGETSPRVQGRLGLPAYKVGGQTIENMIPNLAGALERRPGTRYVANATGAIGSDSTSFSSNGSVLIPFIVATGSSYMLELSDYKMRFYRDGGVLLPSRVNFDESDIDVDANQFHINAHGFYHGQTVTLHLNEGATVPGGLADDTSYAVVIPEALPALGTVTNPGGGDTYAIDADEGFTFNLDPGMGPYNVIHKDVDSFPPKVPVWVHSNDDTETARFTLTKGGLVIGPTADPADLSTEEITIVPLLETKLNTFQLALDTATYTTHSRLRNSRIDISDIGAGGGYFEATDPTAPYELETPWSYEEALQLQWTSEADTLFFFGGENNFPPYELLRFGASSFVLRRIDFTGGPLDRTSPLGADVTMTGTIDGGNVDLDALVKMTCSANFFKGTDVGRPFRKEYADALDSLKYVDGIIERLDHADDHSFFDCHEYIVQGGNGPALFIRGEERDVSPTIVGLEAGDLVWAVPMRQKELYTFSDVVEERTPYYVLSYGYFAGASLLAIAATPGGTPLEFDSVDEKFRIVCGDMYSINGNTGQNATHPFITGQKDAGVFFYGDPPHGIDTGYAYKIVKTSDYKFRLTTPEGEEVPLSTAGNGRMVCSAASQPGGVVAARLRMARPPALDVPNSPMAETDKWRMSRWNALDGWPGAGTIHREILVAGGSHAYPTTLWGSQLAQLRDFSPDSRTGSEEIPSDQQRTITEASGWSYILDNENTDRILWLHPSTVIVAGSAGPVHTIEGLTPTTVTATLMTTRGASRVRPTVSDAQIIWGSSKHHHIFAAGFQESRAGFVPDDITKMSDHLLTRSNNLIQITLQEEPWSVIWAVREDGQILTCTYDQEQGTQAWARHLLGGAHSITEFDYKTREETITTRPWAKATSIASMPSTDGRSHEVWIVTERHPAGSTDPDDIFRSVEYFERRFELDEDKENASFVDCGVPPTDVEEDTSTFNVHDVLKEQLLDGWIDGAIPSETITPNSSGVVTLETAAEYKIVAGLPYRWKFVSNSLESLIQDNPTLTGTTSEITHAYIGLVNTLGITIGSPGVTAERPAFRTRSSLLDHGPELYTGLLEIRGFPGNAENTNILEVMGTGPEPALITNIIARLNFHDVTGV